MFLGAKSEPVQHTYRHIQRKAYDRVRTAPPYSLSPMQPRSVWRAYLQYQAQISLLDNTFCKTSGLHRSDMENSARGACPCRRRRDTEGEEAGEVGALGGFVADAERVG